MSKQLKQMKNEKGVVEAVYKERNETTTIKIDYSLQPKTIAKIYKVVTKLIR